jgi:hypothetical protein
MRTLKGRGVFFKWEVKRGARYTRELDWIKLIKALMEDDENE